MPPWTPMRSGALPLDEDSDGIFHGRTAGPRYEELSQVRMARLLADIPARGVREALHDELVAGDIVSSDFLFAESRHRFLEHLPSTAPGRALEIGSGWGSIARALAARYAEVVTIEGSYDRLRFSQLWHREEGLSNIRYVHAGFGDVDLRGTPFDLVVLNGSLEWLPFEFPRQHPRRTQLEALHRIRSALRSDGILYIGIENRVSLYALAGHVEPHTGIRFQSVLPRAAANVLARIHARRPNTTVPAVGPSKKYLNYTYSYGGYRRLLRDAGFGTVEFLIPWPSYNQPDRLLKDADGLIAAYQDHALYRKAVGIGRLSPSALWRLAPGYAIYARL